MSSLLTRETIGYCLDMHIEYCYGPKWPCWIYIYIYIAYIGLFGTGKCRFFKWVELPVQRDSARFSEVASGNPTSTCIPRVDG